MQDKTQSGERVAKLIARAGLCSRREAEAWIADGRVSLDGEPLSSAAVNVDDPGRLSVDGKPLPAREEARLFRFHKPSGVLTTARDPEGRPTIYQRLPPGLPRLMPIGRLDMTSEGLLLLTNDGELKRKLELPETGWLRRYRVRALGRVEESRLQALAKGIEVDGQRYGPIAATLERQQGANLWLTMALREGKNREVRRVCEALGLKVNRLIRVSYGPFMLGKLPPGEIEEVSRKAMREMLGAAFSRRPKSEAKNQPPRDMGKSGKDADRRRKASRP